jgi:Arc/MetJ family transcription regulator
MFIWVKKTFYIDDELFREAKSACGAATDTETVRLGLQALVRRAAYERLRALRGTEPNAREAPRRREPQKRRGPTSDQGLPRS